jgi:hypothetical protein
VPADYKSPYPYSPDGRMPGAEDSPIPDPLIWLAYVAAATERIKLGTGILILPQRNPIVLAKELATLDRLSAGRLLLGIGLGWLGEEFDAIGVPFGDRGARADEYVAALRALWTEDAATFHGEYATSTTASCDRDRPRVSCRSTWAVTPLLRRGRPADSATASSRPAQRTTTSPACWPPLGRPLSRPAAIPTPSRCRSAATVHSVQTRSKR